MDVLERIDFLAYVVNMAFSVICGMWSFRRARDRAENALFFYLLAGFYACILLGNGFYVLTWVVVDYPYVISPGDLSWVGGVAFLITVALAFMDTWTLEQREAARQYRLPASIAPAVCIALYIANIKIYPEIVANCLLYGIPMVILSFHTMRHILFRPEAGRRPGMRLYHFAVLIWIANQLLLGLFSSMGWYYGYAIHILILDVLLMLVTPGIYFVAVKEIEA